MSKLIFLGSAGGTQAKQNVQGEGNQSDGILDKIKKAIFG